MKQDEMKQNSHKTGVKVSRISAMALSVVMAFSSGYANAGAREQAKRMHDRLTGVSPTPTALDAIESELSTNGAEAAAQFIMDPAQNPQAKNFYNVTLKNFAMPWTNRDQSMFEPLNDYVATVIGMVRDSDTVSFDQLLYGDIVYVGQGNGIPAYSSSNNNHYEYLENNGLDLSQVLVQQTQSSLPGGLPSTATAGVMTSRAASRAFFIDGTNRAMFRFTMLNHLVS